MNIYAYYVIHKSCYVTVLEIESTHNKFDEDAALCFLPQSAAILLVNAWPDTTQSFDVLVLLNIFIKEGVHLLFKDIVNVTL